MKFSVKLFLGISIPFSVIILFGGYLLFSFYFSTTMEREVSAAGEGYQYNKFLVQSEMITEKKAQEEINTEELNGTVALYDSDWKEIYDDFKERLNVSYFKNHVVKGRVDYEFIENAGHKYLIMYGMVPYENESIVLITGKEISEVLDMHQQMKEKFMWIYLMSVFTGLLVSVFLSVLFTRPMKELSIAAEEIADGNYGKQIDRENNDEIGRLALSFNRMSMAVKEKVDELSDNAKRKEDFVANFAHELKTPLTSIIGYADRIYKKDLDRENQKEAAWYIWNEGMHLEALSSKLMDITMMNHNVFILEGIQSDLLIEEFSHDLSYRLGENGTEIKNDMENAYVKVEYDLFKSLFFNLIDNAIKADAKNIIVTGRIEMNRGLYKIKIKDDGKGIPPEEVNRITEAFYMVDKSRSRKMHGAGLGLALAEKIANIHGSTLKFQSDGKNGTEVSFYLKCEV